MARLRDKGSFTSTSSQQYEILWYFGICFVSTLDVFPNLAVRRSTLECLGGGEVDHLCQGWKGLCGGRAAIPQRVYIGHHFPAAGLLMVSRALAWPAFDFHLHARCLQTLNARQWCQRGIVISLLLCNFTIKPQALNWCRRYWPGLDNGL